MTLSRCAVSFGPYTDATGDVVFAGLRGEIRPSRRVVETATGVVVVATSVPVLLDDSGTATVSLAHTDQAGVDGPFHYSITWRSRTGDPSPGEKAFALPVAAGATQDFDLLEPSPDVAEVSVPIAASLTQVQEAADAATAAAGSAAASAADAADAAEAASLAEASAASSASLASTAQQAATQAQGSADGALTASVQAQQAAEDASASASTAVTAASDAATQAGVAATAATTTSTQVGQQYVAAAVVADNLILTRSNGGTTDAGNVRGPQGIPGVKGDVGDMTPVSQAPALSGTVTITSAMLPSTRSWTLSGNLTIALHSTLPAATVSGTITLVLKQATSGGPFTVTWPGTLEWAGDAPAPTMPTVANAELIVHLLWTGVAWRAMVGGTFFP